VAQTEDFKDHGKIVDAINSNAGNKWRARVYPEFEGKSIKQLNQMAGRRKYNQKHDHKTAKQKSFAQVNQGEYSSMSDLPEQFSWEQYLDNPV
jgi:hypothetical protein